MHFPFDPLNKVPKFEAEPRGGVALVEAVRGSQPQPCGQP
jgi:hypothetical protein